ncbi:30S ribosomal protein S4 [Spiroplasma endosymbiont of Nephrotoma flavescens]|uniref:30S ribosomal protein S4 n=1 Tax=Spiroplasma endosymbiont of Nephrotoma flavescens TaxID=3066302 RepID=UPI00313AF760
MSRYTGAIFRIARRVGFSILETGKEFAKGKKRTTAPGQHGARRRKLSNYGLQQQEKQKVRYMYGLNEKQFRNTFLKAKKMSGVTGTNFLILLESRLDNIVYRLGLARTRSAARQLVNHSHILVNNKKVNIPSYHVSPNDKITIKENYKNNPKLLEAIELNAGTLEFVSFDRKNIVGTYIRYPERNELNSEINESLIVEWYNRII